MNEYDYGYGYHDYIPTTHDNNNEKGNDDESNND